MLRHWVSLYDELLYRQQQELQEHLHLNENTTDSRGFTACVYTQQCTQPGKQGGGHMEVKRLSSRGKLVMPEILKL